MKTIDAIALGLAGLAIGLGWTSNVSAQITINELVINERSYSGNVADTAEFIELYNAGATAVDLSNWSLDTVNLATGALSTVFVIPTGHSIAPGGYFVAGSALVPNVNYVLAGEIFADTQARVLDLRDSSFSTVDAVAYEVWRAGATGLSFATAEQQAQVGKGFQGQMFSFIDAFAPNEKTSWSRYRDGRDNNSNGRDFGFVPLTPGATNNVLPVNAKHTVPDVDALPVGTGLPQYNASFVMPTVIDPTTPGAYNPRAIPASPQGGNAIVAWDPVGGGNTVYSEELVHSYDIYAYFDTAPLGIPGQANQQYEISTYGIGASDARFAIANPLGTVTTNSPTENANTGIGWYYEKYQTASGTVNSSKLLLMDFGDGGNSSPGGDWQVKHEIDMSLLPSGWYRLGISHDPVTGEVVARFDDQTFNFTTTSDLLGTFYVGYREVISPTSPLSLFNPPIFDMVAVAQAGDFNGDGNVDGADFVIWQTNFPNNTGGATLAMGDANGDGNVDGADFVIWQTNFPTIAGSATPVPEPSAALLVLAAAVALAARRGWR